ncbi:MAG: response regulator transcription factor [Mucilaginibacter sp.]
MTESILLIENDNDIRDIITYVLEDEGFAVLHTSSQVELDAITRLKPDLVLIDEWLSAEPGHRLCLRIKQLEAFSAIPVIILSTAGNIEQITAECRADTYIRKPFDLTELLGTIKKQLSRRA